MGKDFFYLVSIRLSIGQSPITAHPLFESVYQLINTHPQAFPVSARDSGCFANRFPIFIFDPFWTGEVFIT